MKQLTVGVVLALISDLKNEGMSLADIANLPIYIGNDDELNGIHTAWYANAITEGNPNDEGFIELINEDNCNVEFNGKAILIS